MTWDVSHFVCSHTEGLRFLGQRFLALFKGTFLHSLSVILHSEGHICLPFLLPSI